MCKVFHHNDDDGNLAGHIVGLYEDDVEFFSMSYETPVPFDKIKKDEKVYMVDFSLQRKGEFEKLLGITKNLIWIDHHQTSIEDSKGKPWGSVEGIREIGKAGCELTWEYLFPEEEMPLIVEMVGRFDVWDFSSFGDALQDLVCGLRLYETSPGSETWDSLIEDEACVDELLEKGEIAKNFRDDLYASYLKKCGFECEFEGYKTICCNMGQAGTMLFDSIDKESYDLMASFSYNGATWSVSLYSTKDSINCGGLCKKYGGGGHKGAAGFTTKDLPFTKIGEKKS